MDWISAYRRQLEVQARTGKPHLLRFVDNTRTYDRGQWLFIHHRPLVRATDRVDADRWAYHRNASVF